MKIYKTNVKNINNRYSILIGFGAINQLKKNIRSVCPNTKKIALIFDKKIPNRMLNKVKRQIRGYKIFVYKYSVNENLKSFEKVNSLNESLLAKNFNRNDLLIAVGGGVIGDFAGFAASILKRGVNFINLPSTLLAQVDSSIGGKTGVNSKKGKNLIGTFYQPKLVISELEFSSWYTNLPIIAITGSNGKTTTTKLLENIFRETDLNIFVSGNIGIPFSEIILDNIEKNIKNGLHIIEVSSFQLEDIHLM